VVLLGCGVLGCGTQPTGTTDPEAKLRLERIRELFQMYADQKQKGPPNEQAFKDFIRQLPRDQREPLGVGDDVDSFLVSPRDGQKYVLRWNYRPRFDQNKAIAWEQTGQDGKRFVALSMGYVEEKDEAELAELKK
jgi:hypothetical protein